LSSGCWNLAAAGWAWYQAAEKPVLGVRRLAAVTLITAVWAVVASLASFAAPHSGAAEQPSPSPWPLLYDWRAVASAWPPTARRPQVPDLTAASFPASPVDRPASKEFSQAAAPQTGVHAAPSSSSVPPPRHRPTAELDAPASAGSHFRLGICSCETITDHHTTRNVGQCPT